MSRTLLWGVIGSTLVLVFGVWLISRNAAILHEEINAKLENKFGFTSVLVSIQMDAREINFLSVAPKKDGLLFQAGFRDGDIIVSHSKVKFYKLLYEKNGSMEPIEIIRGKDVSSIGEGLHKTISFHIPN